MLIVAIENRYVLIKTGKLLWNTYEQDKPKQGNKRYGKKTTQLDG